VIDTCSPPMTAYRGSSTSGESAIWKSCTGDDPGDMTEIAFTDFADSDQNSNPRLSPDRANIAFTVLGASTGYDEVWVVSSVVGSTPVKLADDPANYLWHPGWIDSDTIVYLHYDSGSFDDGAMYSVPAAGGTPTLLLTPPTGWTQRRPQGNFDGTNFVMDVATQNFLTQGTGLEGNVYANFESSNYGSWTTTGSAFGSGPVIGPSGISGFLGSRLVNSYGSGDANTGMAARHPGNLAIAVILVRGDPRGMVPAIDVAVWG
jgi:hypothetical protein